MNKKNKRRVSMLLNSQTIYHIQKEAEREGITIGEVIDRMVRDKRISDRFTYVPFKYSVDPASYRQVTSKLK